MATCNRYQLWSDELRLHILVPAKADMKPLSLQPFLPRPAIRRRLPQHARRRYALQTPAAPTRLHVFNDNRKYLQRERAATDAEGSRRADYLRDEVAARLAERLLVSSSSHLTLTSNEFSSGHQAGIPQRPRPWRKCLQPRSSSYITCRRLPTSIDATIPHHLRRLLAHPASPRPVAPFQQPPPFPHPHCAAPTRLTSPIRVPVFRRRPLLSLAPLGQ